MNDPTGRLGFGRISIRKSALHGWGVFAVQPFASEALVLTEPALRIPVAEVPPSSMVHCYGFECPGDRRWVLLGSLVGHMNHATHPNTWVQVRARPGDVAALAVFALRAIETGEELTIHYLGEPGSPTLPEFYVPKKGKT